MREIIGLRVNTFSHLTIYILDTMMNPLPQDADPSISSNSAIVMANNNNIFGSPPKEYEDDSNEYLGRANGNIYRRKPGVDGVHDGQIMVRLKKKRYLVLDYSPEAGGRQVCSCTNCSKVAVPALLYDSDPNEPSSLYLRSGHCFTCQRSVNEKRRSQRRSDGNAHSPLRVVGGTAQNHEDAPPSLPQIRTSGNIQLQSNKKSKVTNHEFSSRISPSAIIIDGPLEGTKLANSTNYGFSEIGIDVLRFLQEAVQDTDQLVSIVGRRSEQEASMVTTTDNNTSTAIAVAAAIAAGTEVVTASDTSASSTQVAEVEAMYQKAMLSAKKCVFLLGQWKASWDSSIVLPSVEQQLLFTSPSTDNCVGVVDISPPDTLIENPSNMEGALSNAKEEILPEAKAELETFAV